MRFKLREQEGESPERHWCIGISHSGYRKSRRQEIENLQGENPETHQRSDPSIWDTWRLTSLRHIGGSGVQRNNGSRKEDSPSYRGFGIGNEGQGEKDSRIGKT
jgi:hypothetical protein